MLKGVIDWSVDNRFLVCVLAVLMAVGGAWSMSKTPLDAIPDLSDVQVIVQADWPGRDPKTIEDQITYPISSALLNTSNVRDVRGFSFFGTSFVYVVFQDGTDPYWARSRVLERLSQVQGELPPGTTPALGPDGSGLGWVYLYTLEQTQSPESLAGADGASQEVLDLGGLRDLQDHYVRHQLESVPGVAEVATLGGAVRQFQVTVDPTALVAYGLGLRSVTQAIQRSNRDVGGRLIEMAETEYMVRGRGRVRSVRDLETLVVGTTSEGTPVQLADVAEVNVGPDIKRGIAEKNGAGEVVAGIVTMRYGENALRVIDAVKAKIAEISPGLPEGVVIRKAYDRSGLIRRSVGTLSKQLLEELLIVALVCIVFLWHARSALVSVVVLPLSILASLFVMRLFGVSANIMSLGGIAIAIGTMVDAAVVMVENLHKHKEEGDDVPHWELVRRASHEVGPALFFSLLVITVSFLPVFALEDQAGRLFRPLAFTKTLAMGCAALLTLLLMPVLMGLFVHGRIRRESENPISRVTIALYLPLLRFALARRKTAIGLALVLLAITIVPLARLGSEFMPSIREGDVLAMPTTLPGISSTEARRTLQIQDRLLKEFPEVEVVLGKIGRADTALDPAPLAMVETHITLLPEARWPRRILEQDWLEDAARELARSVEVPEGAEQARSSEAAHQAALMSHATLTRWIREELVAGRPPAEVRERLPERVRDELARDLSAWVASQGALDAARAEVWRAELIEGGWIVAGDEIPLRRTTYDELVDGEMHRHVQIPGMPNWWLMPIETRVGMLATGMRGRLGLKLYGQDLADLARVATQLEQVLKDVPGTSSVIAERALGGHYLDLEVDREACARHGVAVGDVQDVIQSAIGGMTVSTAIDGRSRIPIQVRFPRELRDDPVRLGRTQVAAPGGRRVPLAQLASIALTDGPPVIKSENGLLLTNVPIDLEPGADIGSYVEDAQQVLDQARADGRLDVPPGTYTSWSGEYQLMQQVRRRLDVIVPLTLVVIFLLVYLNLRDVTETLIAMATLPFALIGGVWLMHWMGYDVSVAVVIGFLALAGLATETSLLMHVYLDLARRRRVERGAASAESLSADSLREAIVEGAVLRVRPKMMTVVTTVLALLPILWATGAGSGPMKRMAVPMIGGLFTSTLHTLILIPVYYAMVHEWRARRAALRS